jgi:hypothetical protein
MTGHQPDTHQQRDPNRPQQSIRGRPTHQQASRERQQFKPVPGQQLPGQRPVQPVAQQPQSQPQGSRNPQTGVHFQQGQQPPRGQQPTQQPPPQQTQQPPQQRQRSPQQTQQPPHQQQSLPRSHQQPQQSPQPSQPRRTQQQQPPGQPGHQSAPTGIQQPTRRPPEQQRRQTPPQAQPRQQPQYRRQTQAQPQPQGQQVSQQPRGHGFQQEQQQLSPREIPGTRAQIRAVEDGEEYVHVRIRNPDAFETIRTPDWASKAADSVHEGSEVRTGKLKGSDQWSIESVLVEKPVDADTAIEYASRIVQKIEG